MKTTSSHFEKQISASRKSTTLKSKTDWPRLKSETVDVKPTKEQPQADVKHIVRGMVRKGLKPLPANTTNSLRVDQDKLAKSSNFDSAPYLDSDEAIAAYLTDILAANDSALLAAALGDIARARGMSEIAKASGITREALYKALRPDAQPRFDTVNRVCAALGVKLVAQVASA